MNSKSHHQTSKDNTSQNPAQIWADFINEQKKNGSKIGRCFENGQFRSYENKIILICFQDEAAAKQAKGQAQAACQKLPRQLQPCDRIECKVGQALTTTISQKSSTSRITCRNPLAAINHASSEDEKTANSIFAAAKTADQSCQPIYTKLTQRLRLMVGQSGQVFTANFPWRLRVGGQRGFDDLLMPALHPIFGVPYIPASSLKGAATAWAKRDSQTTDAEVREIFGFLEGKKAQVARIEIFDAFPTKPSLSVDVATPQWRWNGDRVNYKPEPHPLLTLQATEILFGVRPTKPQYAKYVPTVIRWLKGALSHGIGSRVSSGYGQTLQPEAQSSHVWKAEFTIWTQGIFGSEPPSKSNRRGEPEFRPTALRGVLRYWFRAMALKLYSPAVAKELETQAFGELSRQGEIGLQVVINPDRKEDPYCYQGCLQLQAKSPKFLELAKKLTILAAHLGGFGRGARRPLHCLDQRMRGCDWTLELSDYPLPCEKKAWQKMFNDTEQAFTAIRPSGGAISSNPGQPKNRYQDVLDKNTQIWLVPSPGQIEPSKVDNWRSQGSTVSVRGIALNWFYNSTEPYFKGKNRDGDGNENVGGGLETPSFVWIRSLFPRQGNPYQVVTVFGFNHHRDRKRMVDDIAKMKDTKTKDPLSPIQVFP